MNVRIALTSVVACLLIDSTVSLHAAPYASNVKITGTTVNFLLNEPATLSYRINGGPAISLSGAVKGPKSFTLGSSADTFSITTEKTDAVGYTIATGGTVDYSDPNDPSLKRLGLYDPSPLAGLNIISDDASSLTRFNSPRGVGVSKNPNAPNFGTIYISNSQESGNPGDPPFDGMYALGPDGSDILSRGKTAANPTISGLPAFGEGINSPFKVMVPADGTPYIADWSDSSGSLTRMSRDLTSGTRVLNGIGGVPDFLEGQNHGSVGAVYVEGSPESGNLVVYTADEDITTNFVTGSGPDNDQNSLWRYNIGGASLPYSVMPTRLSDVLQGDLSPDITRGADGKWYLVQLQEQAENTPTLFVLSPDASTVLYNSLEDTRAIKGDPFFSHDILQYAFDMAVSPDQNWMALMLGGSDVAVIPLANGIPQLEDRMIVKSAVDVFAEESGRAVEFDAAGNIHYVSSGQERYRVLAPGGHTIATTSWNGSSFAFDISSSESADFDGDGDIDGRDFLTWQRGFGLLGSADPEDGDANGDGDVDAADLVIWQAQYGSPALTATTTAVPEPATLVVSAFAFALIGCNSRLRRDLARE